MCYAVLCCVLQFQFLILSRTSHFQYLTLQLYFNCHIIMSSLCSLLFQYYFLLFCPALSYRTLFCSILFNSLLYCSLLFLSDLFYSILFCLFCSILFCSVYFVLLPQSLLSIVPFTSPPSFPSLLLGLCLIFLRRQQLLRSIALVLSNDQLFTNLQNILKAPMSESTFFDLSALPVWWCPWIHDIGKHVCRKILIELMSVDLPLTLNAFSLPLLPLALCIVSLSLLILIHILVLPSISVRSFYRLLETRIPRSSQHFSRYISPLQPEGSRGAH